MFYCCFSLFLLMSVSERIFKRSAMFMKVFGVPRCVNFMHVFGNNAVGREMVEPALLCNFYIAFAYEDNFIYALEYYVYLNIILILFSFMEMLLHISSEKHSLEGENRITCSMEDKDNRTSVK